MIEKTEILDLSKEFSLRPDVLEKDYALGWLLDGISKHAALGNQWVFKGGTCLKKCFFETYRFSEDLDFTISNPEHLNGEWLLSVFKDISESVYESTGLEFPADLIRFDVYKNVREGLSAEGRVGYKGPLGKGGDLPRIKLDLTTDEVIVKPPLKAEVHHPYSDKPEGGIHIYCYPFEEVFAEKIRALMERLRPRDLYDVVHIHRRNDYAPDNGAVLDILKKKCEYKGLSLPTKETIQSSPKRDELEAEWENMLSHQLPSLPSFEQFWGELPEVFDWLYGVTIKAVPQPIAVGKDVDLSWKPPAFVHAWGLNAPMEVIRFAASNRLCVKLGYIDSKGQYAERNIEPYSLRRTKDGNLILYAIKHDSGETRSYRVDRIQNAIVTDITFTPRYTIELTSQGALQVQPVSSRQTGPHGFRTHSKIKSLGRGSSGLKSGGFGPKYVFECSFCGKKFTRTKYNSTLNPHKDKDGYQCAGRAGIYIDTKY